MYVKDDFLTKKDLEWCQDNLEELFDYSGIAYLWWDGWLKKPADNLIFEYMQLVWKDYNPLNVNFDDGGWTGFEYWTNEFVAKDIKEDYTLYTDSEGSTIHPGSSGDWHVDDCVHSRKSEGRALIARYSCVFYLDVDCQGGFFELTNLKAGYNDLGGSNSAISKYAEDNPSRIERVKCVPNRVVIFDPSYYHRVSEVTKGHRRAITTNLWSALPYTAEKGYSPITTSADIASIRPIHKFENR